MNSKASVRANYLDEYLSKYEKTEAKGEEKLKGDFRELRAKYRLFRLEHLRVREETFHLQS